MSNSESQEQTPTTYNGPWLRSQLLTHANYVASNEFPDLWKWRASGGALSKLMVDHSDGEAEEVFCRVVGVISEDRAFLDKHGSYSPKFDTPMHKSKLQFTLMNPNDADFGKDFSVAYARLEAVQDNIATGKDRSWFLINGTMRFSYPLWEIKHEGNSGSYETELTEQYQMRSDYDAVKVETQDSYQIRIMCVLKMGSDDLLQPSKFRTALPGALVDVTFTLRHNYINGANSYSAHVQQVIILKPAPPPTPSPFQDRSKRGALSFSQSPRKKSAPSRNDQISGVQAFGPVSSKAAEKRKQPDSEVVASSSKKPREAARST